MKPAAIFATATALALLAVAGAMADGNVSWLSQDGDRNTATVDQSAGDRNHAGAEVPAIRQIGDRNSLGFTQSGKGNRIGTAGSGFLQSADRNEATILQSSNNNIVREVTQTGIDGATVTGNTLSIVQQGGNANLVASVVQTRTSGPLTNGRPGNTASIVQDGAANVVGLLSQVGRGNDATLTFDGNLNRADSGQRGANNDALVSVTGNLNLVSLDQESLLLGNSAKVTIDRGNLNVVRLGQSGSNEAVLSIDGNANLVSVNQSGANRADISVEGNLNRVAASQDGAGNTIDIAIRGHGSNLLPFAGGPSGALAGAVGLAPGDVVQTGLLNSISYELGAGSASNNRFAFSQDGAGNVIDGKTFGTSNEVVVVQEGIGNITSFFQVGNANVIGVNQGARP